MRRAEYPLSIDMLVGEENLFRSYKRAQKRVSKLEERRELFCVGRARVKGMAPRNVYAARRIKRDNVMHEYLLSRFLWKFPEAQIERGLNLPHNADAVM